MLKIIISIFLFTFLLCACNKTQNGVTKKYSNVVLLDDFENNLILDTVQYKRIAQFSPLYVGAIKDSIQLTYKAPNITYKTKDWTQFRTPKATDLEIYIDTTKTIGFSMPIWKYYTAPEYREQTKSYPVFIKNKSTDTLNIAIGNMLTMVTEIKNSKNVWIPLEQKFLPGCGVGLNMLYLPPNEIAITALRQNFGTIATKQRIRFELGVDKNCYSNVVNSNLTHQF